jgi:hypothetical protein
MLIYLTDTIKYILFKFDDSPLIVIRQSMFFLFFCVLFVLQEINVLHVQLLVIFHLFMSTGVQHDFYIT